MPRIFIILHKSKAVLVLILVFVGLHITGARNYLLFHTSAEMFSIVVAFSIFMLVWNVRRFMDNNYLLFLGIAYFFIGGIDLAHTIGYEGMGVLPGGGGNLAAQLWLGARFIEALSILAAPFFLGRKLRVRMVFAVFGVLSFLLLLAVLYWKVMPVCYQEPGGLTAFKKGSEYVICGILLVSIVLLLRKRIEFDGRVVRLLVGSIALTIASELCFTLYKDVYGFMNELGHFLKLVSFYLIYKAIFQTGVVKPYVEVLRQITERRQLEKAVLEISDREQRRLGRELHDSVGQLLAGAGLMLKVLEQKLAPKSPSEASYAAKIAALVSKTTDQTRHMSKGLSPLDIEVGGIKSAFEELASNTEDFGVSCEFEYDGNVAPGDIDAAKHVYRIAQEAIANAIKHGKARHIHIRLAGDGKWATLTVRNDGRDFPEGEDDGHGMGLKIMHYRTRLIDGSLTVEKAAEGGTIVSCVFPNKPSDDNEDGSHAQ
jgi:signal transduction histidine kinase